MVNLWNGGFIAPVEDARLEPEASAQADPESEKDRKTAMVLGVSILVFVSATALRLIALWLMGSAAANPADIQAGVERALAKDNVEAFLIEHASRKDAFPDDPEALSIEGALSSSELGAFTGTRTVYKKVGEKGFILK